MSTPPFLVLSQDRKFNLFRNVSTIHSNANNCTFQCGDVLYAPTHILQDFEEIVTPAVPAKPVEPIIGLSWKSRAKTHTYTIVDILDDGTYIVYCRWNEQYCTTSMTVGELAIHAENNINYPITEASPAVTKTVRKWVEL